MTLSATVLWFIAALLLAGGEMLLGTVFLLAVAGGAAAAGCASWAGLSMAWQLALCGLVIVAGSAAILLLRRRAAVDDEAAKLQALDAGRLVRVEAVGSDGLAVVQYRGAPWISRPSETPLTPGLWTIERVDGTQLVLGRRVG